MQKKVFYKLLRTVRKQNNRAPAGIFMFSFSFSFSFSLHHRRRDLRESSLIEEEKEKKKIGGGGKLVRVVREVKGVSRNLKKMFLLGCMEIWENDGDDEFEGKGGGGGGKEGL